MQDKKVYVDVVVKIGADGNITPMTVIWNDGRCFEIDRVTEIKRAYAAKVGGTGIRYTVYIFGKRTYLFEDDGKWFVQAN